MSSPRRQASSSSQQTIPKAWLVIAPIGLFLCLANVVIILSQVETHQLDPSLDGNTNNVVSPDLAIRRIDSNNNKLPPPIIRGVKLDYAINKTTEEEGQDNVDEEVDEPTESSQEGEDDDVGFRWSSKESKESTDTSLDEPNDKEPILKILSEAGIHNVDNEIMQALPTWKQVTSLYGFSPKLYGLETCETFRNHSEPAEHFVGTAGNFNSGTNLLSELLIHNCVMTARMKKYGSVNKGVRWQVPWGKHSPPLDAEFRRTHKTKPGDKNIDAHNVMPIVTIRDPYVWAQSMCRHQYGAYWPSDTGHCPNLVPDERDFKQEPWLKHKESVPIDVQYSVEAGNRQHDSLIHFWNEWYSDYLQADFPRVLVRFEDLIFHAKDVTTQVCECAGGTMLPNFRYITNSAKKGTPGAHGSDQERTSLVDAIIRYGSGKGRLDGFTTADIEFARKHLNLKLMRLFDYQFDDPPVSTIR